MAIYHLRLKVISRSLGRDAKPGGATRRSVVAAAAYRSGQPLYDDSQGKWFEFHKPDVTHTEILAPENISLPKWIFDRQTLWNMVERAETRVDSQLAREVEITLPRELTKDQQVALVHSFVKDQFVKKGMVADIAIHRPTASDGKEQPHAHVLLLMRRVDAASATGFAAKKERAWSERDDVAKVAAEARKRFNDTQAPHHKQALAMAESLRNVNIWRANWAAYANRALDAAGSAARIDHRTLEAQGIARKPQTSISIARHVREAYSYLKERLTNWVALQKRSEFYIEAHQYRRNDPVKLAEFLLRLSDMAEDFAAHYRRPQPIPEVPLDR